MEYEIQGVLRDHLVKVLMLPSEIYILTIDHVHTIETEIYVSQYGYKSIK